TAVAPLPDSPLRPAHARKRLASTSDRPVCTDAQPLWHPTAPARSRADVPGRRWRCSRLAPVSGLGVPRTAPLPAPLAGLAWWEPCPARNAAPFLVGCPALFLVVCP